MLVACQDEQVTTQNDVVATNITQATADSAAQQNSLEALRQQLDKVTENKQCSTDTVCRVLPVGKRACGGPSGFVVFSTEYSDEATVKTLASQITALENTYNLSTNAMSICEHLSEPTVQCIASTCAATNGNNPAF